MLDARGLITFVVTFHEVSLIFSVVLAALMTLPFWLLMLRSVERGRKATLALVFFVGTALVCHFIVSHTLHFSALDVEVIQVGQSIDDGPPVEDKPPRD